jgi:hypothetical protein
MLLPCDRVIESSQLIYLTQPILTIGVANLWYERLKLQKIKQALQGASQGKQPS